MASLLQRAFSRLLESTPNYIEVTAVLAVALIGRLLLLPDIWKASPQACVAAALLVSVLLYACVEKGQLFAYLGWIRPRHRLWWAYAPTGGILGALVVIWIIRAAGLSPGTDAPGRLLYGVTVGPIMEEVIFRGAAFSIIYVTASSISALAQWRTALSIAASSVLFALAHTTIIGIPWLVFFGMGMLYALLRVAIELNRHRCSHARYVQRGHCLRNAESLDHSDMCSLRYKLHKKLCNLTEPSNR